MMSQQISLCLTELYHMADDAPAVHPAASPRSRAWRFTINNPDLEAEVLLRTSCRYIVFQLEEGSEGTPHYQGFVYFPGARTRSAVVNTRIGDARPFARAWLAPPNDDHYDRMIAYCKKEEGRLAGPYERGVPPQPRKSKVLQSMVAELQDVNKSYYEVAKQDIFIAARHERTLQAARSIALRIKAESMGYRFVKVLFIWSEQSNVGKSRLAHYIGNSHGHRAWREHQPRNKDKWNFNGYDGQDTLIIEDGFYEHSRMPDLLELLDGYFHRVGKFCLTSFG